MMQRRQLSFFFNDTATTEIYTLSLHDALPIFADVAEKYDVPMVKLTGGQRIDLLGIKKEDLPGVWADLDMPSGYAYGKSFRTVKTCVGRSSAVSAPATPPSSASTSRPGCRAWRARPR